MTLPTFSQLPRWFACQLGDVLPSAQETGDDARAGQARHRFFQRVTELVNDPKAIVNQIEGDALEVRRASLDEARELALAEAPEEHQDVLAAIPLEALRLDTVAAEVALAIDVTTGEARELGRGIERDYSSRKPTEIVGTIDRLGLIGQDGLHIGDYKGRSHRREPTQDEQFLAAALAATRVYGRTHVEIEVLRVIGDEVRPAGGRVDQVALDQFELRLQDRVAQAEANRAAFKTSGATPEAEVSDHCRYCPHLRFCPAQGTLVRHILGGDSAEVRAIEAVGAAYLDEVSAARLWVLLGQAEKRLELLKSALRDFARQSPVNLPDGRRYGVPPDSTQRKIIDGRKAELVLAEIFGVDAAKKGAAVEVSFEGIERAVKAWISEDARRGKRGAIKEAVERAESALRDRGLLTITSGGVVKPFKPKEA